MEQNNELKIELQQELRGLQQEIEQHSSFNTEVWREKLKQQSKELYWQNAIFPGFLVIIMIAGTVVLALIKWPWWLILLFDLYFGWLLVDSLVATIGLRKADVQSRKGLLSLRESINAYSKRRRTTIRIVGILLYATLAVCLLFYDRSAFFAWLLWGGLFYFPFGRKETKRSTKPYEELAEEIDELLKE